jgi:protein ImuB
MAGRFERVIACNPSAATLGVKPGQRRSAAQALSTSLHIAPRQSAQEQALLESLASWCLQFTSTVAVDLPDGLLLEIEGSLRYFRGLPRLRAMIMEGLAGLNMPVHPGLAPTPLAAAWLARVGDIEPILDVRTLSQRLGRLPLRWLPWPNDLHHKLHELGLRRLQQVLDLPRDGMGRRFGPELPLWLARALGEVPDPRQLYIPPDQFQRQIELNWATDQVEALGFVAKRLLTELAAFLMGRGMGVQQIMLTLRHEDRTHSNLEVGFGKPTRSADAMLAITRERLARLTLPAPATHVGLSTTDLHQLDGQALTLFNNHEREGDFSLLRARLVARLGENAVKNIRSVSDHRPERAWQPTSAPVASQAPKQGDRPGWLLSQPERLEIRFDHPWYNEPLMITSNAERIEAGWEEGESMERDYFHAEAPSGKRYWIFRNCSEDIWYLHGLFG